MSATRLTAEQLAQAIEEGSDSSVTNNIPGHPVNVRDGSGAPVYGQFTEAEQPASRELTDAELVPVQNY